MKKHLTIGLALAVILSLLASVAALADTIVADGDIVTSGDQVNVNLGTVLPGAVLHPQVSFTLVCDSKQHVDQGQTVSLAASPQTVPAGGSLSASDASIGAIPGAWPDDTTGGGTTNCNSTPQTMGDNGNSQVTITAPNTAGPYSYVVRYSFSVSPAGNSDNSALKSNHEDVTYTLTVAAPTDTTPPVINYTLNPASPDGSNGWYKSSVSLTWSVSDPESAVTKTGCVDQNITADQAATNYSCSASSAGGSAGPVTVSIKRDATAPGITWGGGINNGDSFVYGSVPAAPTCTATDALSGPDTCAVTGYGSTVGNYTLTAAASDKAGNVKTETRSYTVTPADAVCTVNGYGGAYDGDAHGATGSCKGVGGVTLTGLDLGASFTDVPGGTAHWTFSAANYKAQGGDAAIVISKADPVVTVNGYTGTYDGNAHGASGTATGVKGETLSGLDLDASFTNVPGGTAHWTFANANYKDQSGDAPIIINQRAATWTTNNNSKTYGDADPNPLTTGSGTFLTADNVTATYSRSAGEAANDYPITATLGPAGVLANYNITNAGATFTIRKRPVTVTAGAQSKTYGDADPALTYQVTAGSLVGSDGFSGALTRDAGEDVGSYSIQQGTLALSDNYDLTYVGATLTIDARPVTATADAKSKTFGDADPALTYQITSGSLVGGDAFTGSLARLPGENVGSYAIQQGTLALGDNYEMTYVGANLTINKRPITVTADARSKVYGDPDPALTYQVTSGNLVGEDALTGTLTRAAGQNVGSYAIQQGTLSAGDNYDLTYVGADLTIAARPISVTAGAQSKTYGDADPALTYEITSGNLVIGDSFSGALSRVAGEDAGSYAIEQGTLALSSNYDLTYVGANLTINKRPVTVAADANTKVYGDDDPPLTYQISSGKLVNGDTFSGALTRDAGEDVGSHPIQQGTLALSSNYDLTFAGAALTIEKRPVTVTADAKSKVYGDADPALTYKITDGSLAFSDAFSGALGREAGENVGSYDITRGNLALSTNYSLTFEGAKLTITVRPITVTADAKSKVYGDGDPALTYKITNGSLAFQDAFSGTLTRDVGQDVGTYAITEGTLALGSNYKLAYVGADFTITPATLTVTANSITKTLNAPTPPLGYTIMGFRFTDGASDLATLPTCTTTAASTSPAGKYPITCSGGAAKNYVFTYVQGWLSIQYRFDGFLQPINDTAHSQLCGSPCPISVFKGGSTIPVKFVLKDASGNVVLSSSAPVWLAPVQGGAMTAAIDESTYSDPASSGNSYFWDGTQYHYNWSTKGFKTGFYYRIGVMLDDGTTYYVYVGLK